MKIFYKLLLTISINFVLIIIIGIMVNVEMKSMAGEFNRFKTEQLKELKILNNMIISVEGEQIKLQSYLLTNEESIKKEIDARYRQFEESANELKKIPFGTVDKYILILDNTTSRIERNKKLEAEIFKLHSQLIKEKEEKNISEIQRIENFKNENLKKFIENSVIINLTLGELVDFVNEGLDKKIEKITVNNKNSVARIFYLILLIIGLNAVFFWILSKKITKPIIKLRNLTREIAQGNINARINIKSKDEIEELAADFNKMLGDLKKSYRSLKEIKTIVKIRAKARTRELKELNRNLDERVKERTKELQEKIEELEKFYRLTVGREHKMIELKKEIKKLKKDSGNKK